MPTQIFVAVTEEVRGFLESCQAEGAEQHRGAESVDLDELYRLAEEHAQRGGSPVRIHELLAGAEIVERRETHHEPLSDVERLRQESQERRYQQMVKGVVPVTNLKRKEPGMHQQALRFATNFATQVAVAFIGAFLLGYYFVETFVAPENFTAKIIVGAFCSFATLLLETLLLVVHEQKQEMMEQKERERAERAERARRVQSPKNGVAATPNGATAEERTPSTAVEQAAVEAPGSSEPVEELAVAAEPKPLREKKCD